MDGLIAKKKRVVATASFCLASGIICFVLRAVNLNDDYYYYGEHNGLLMGGSICIIMACLLYVYGLVLHSRTAIVLTQQGAFTAIPSNATHLTAPGQHPTAPSLPYQSPTVYQNQTSDIPPGYQQQYPQTHVAQFDPNEPPPPYTEVADHKRY